VWCGVMPFHALPSGLRKSLVDDFYPDSLFNKKFNDSTLKKPHVCYSHFLPVHDGNVRDAHALIRLFVLEKEYVANCLINLVTIFLTNS
jgi:hypothetical protein